MPVIDPGAEKTITHRDQVGADGYVQPPINRETGKPFEVPAAMQALRMDPEPVRQLLWRMGEPIGWPALIVGGMKLPAGSEGWKATIDAAIPLWLGAMLAAAHDSIGWWEAREKRAATSLGWRPTEIDEHQEEYVLNRTPAMAIGEEHQFPAIHWPMGLSFVWIEMGRSAWVAGTHHLRDTDLADLKRCIDNEIGGLSEEKQEQWRQSVKPYESTDNRLKAHAKKPPKRWELPHGNDRTDKV